MSMNTDTNIEVEGMPNVFSKQEIAPLIEKPPVLYTVKSLIYFWFFPMVTSALILYFIDEIYSKGGNELLIPLFFINSLLIVATIFFRIEFNYCTIFTIVLIPVIILITWWYSAVDYHIANKPLNSVSYNSSFSALMNGSSDTSFFTTSPSIYTQRNIVGFYQSFSATLIYGPINNSALLFFWSSSFTPYSSLPIEKDGYVWLYKISESTLTFMCERDLLSRNPSLNYTTKQWVAPSDVYDIKTHAEENCVRWRVYRIVSAIISIIIWSLTFFPEFKTVFTKK